MNVQRVAPLVLIPLALLAAAAAHAADDFTDLDLATLMSMDVTVTSASKRAQATADAAASAVVITREDIRRIGATSLPEILRTVPGVEVARIDARSWAVSVRGFNSRFSNKLLVMIDGRSIYTPLFSGVMWEENPMFLDNIERIEIVRGPGGSLWGINAVNGIINIITRNAADTQGVYAVGGSGSRESDAGLRFGGRLDGVGNYRVYLDHAEVESFSAGAAPLTRTQAGWRADGDLAAGRYTFEGDVLDADYGGSDESVPVRMPGGVDAGNVQAGWLRSFSPGDLDLIAYFGWADRRAPAETEDTTFGFEGQFSARRIGHHLFSIGGGARHVMETQQHPVALMNFGSAPTQYDQWSVYAQDEIRGYDDRVHVILGAKVEDFPFTGVAVQPTLRGLWKITGTQTLWAAVSRAARTPSRAESFLQVDTVMPGEVPVHVTVVGDASIQDEDMNAYELGWRWRPDARLSVDASIYRNYYQDLIVRVPQDWTFVAGPMLTESYVFANATSASAYGMEFTAEWLARDWLRLRAMGAWHRTHDTNLPPGVVASQFGLAGPERSLAMHAHMDLTSRAELDLAWRFVSKVAAYQIPAYDALDVRVGWDALPALRLSLSLENAFDNDHVEFFDETTASPGVRLGRAIFGRVVWQPAL